MMTTTIDELPLPALRTRARTASDLLRRAKRDLTRFDGMVLLDAALDRTERLLPGLLRPTRCAPEHVAAVARLRRADRSALRELLALGGDFARPNIPALETASAGEILDAIERVDIVEALQAELFAVLRALEERCLALA